MSVCIGISTEGDTDVFIEAADEILRLLAGTHETEFTNPELVDITGKLLAIATTRQSVIEQLPHQ